jgi:hypothetical protein
MDKKIYLSNGCAARIACEEGEKWRIWEYNMQEEEGVSEAPWY